MFGHNKGSGPFSQGFGGMMGGSPMGPRQLSLAASEGFSGNGMATIGDDNMFSVIAHLPPTHTFSPHAPAVYAAYLVDGKGKNGFYAGTLKAAGNGMYQTNFRSPVPLVHYDKVVISLESPQSIMQAPQGPIVMMVKDGFMGKLGPVKKVGGDMWGKVKGFVGNRFGGGKEVVPEQPALPQPPVQQYSAQQSYPQQIIQQRGPQPGSYQGGISQGGYPQVEIPQGGMPQRAMPQGYYPQGGYQQGSYRQGGYQQSPFQKGMQNQGMYQQPQSQPIQNQQVNVSAEPQMPTVMPTQDVQIQQPPEGNPS